MVTRSQIKDIRSFFRPIPKIERTESIESSRLSAVQEAPSPPDDDDDGFFVAAPHIVNSPPKLSPIPLIEGMSIHLMLNLSPINRAAKRFLIKMKTTKGNNHLATLLIDHSVDSDVDRIL